jgi:hypothetical protein
MESFSKFHSVVTNEHFRREGTESAYVFCFRNEASKEESDALLLAAGQQSKQKRNKAAS